MPHEMPPDMKPPATVQNIAMLLYPKFTALDLIGPQLFFKGLMQTNIQTVSKTRDPVTSDSNITIVPTATFEDVPSDLTVLFVPGGLAGTTAALADPEVLAFLRKAGRTAAYVTSVCTGSLLLAAAGLLRGYRATGHWESKDLLALMGVQPVDERVVEDGNRITGAGVTAGLDFGLYLAAKLRGVAHADCCNLSTNTTRDRPIEPVRRPVRALILRRLHGN